MATPATTPSPPYHAVIFTSVRSDGDDGYSETARQMLELASRQAGFPGFETAHRELGIPVSCRESPEAIAACKANLPQRHAQDRARDWYKSFRVRVCRVERGYGFRKLPQ